jgi:hypothetical protein
MHEENKNLEILIVTTQEQVRNISDTVNQLSHQQHKLEGIVSSISASISLFKWLMPFCLAGYIGLIGIIWSTNQQNTRDRINEFYQLNNEKIHELDMKINNILNAKNTTEKNN